MQDDNWLAWAAGIMDGEGCIYLSKSSTKRCKECWTLRLKVTNTDPKMLVKLRDILGGTISKNGAVTGLMPSWSWGIRSGRASDTLKILMPWLITKRDQAEAAILSRSLMGVSGVAGSANLPWLRLVHSQLQQMKRQPHEMPYAEFPRAIGE